MGKFAVYGLIGATVLLASSQAWAFDIQNGRPLAMGGAGRAQCPSNSSLYLNPAGLGVGRVYHVETLYGYVPTANGHLAGGSVVDSVTAPIGMGLAFNYLSWDSHGVDRNEYDVRVSAAYYIGRLLSLGLALKYMYADQEGQGPLGNSLFRQNGDQLLNTVTVDVGALLTVGQSFSLGVVGANLTNTESLSAPLTLGVGLGFSLRSLAIVADVLMDFTSDEDTMFRAMGGVEYFAGDHWPIRVGYRWDQLLDTHAISGGLGYMSQRFGIELSFRQDVAGENLHTNILITLLYFSN